MSTRSNILVKVRLNGEWKVVQFYHHWDGYPEGVGRELVAFALTAELMSKPTYDCDNKLKYEETIGSTFGSIISKCDGYEYEKELKSFSEARLHGDIDYLYVVIAKDNGIDVLFKDWWVSELEYKQYLGELDRDSFENFEDVADFLDRAKK